jgi:beta-glucosidase
MNNMRKTICAGAVVLASALPIFAWVTGKVIDGAGKGVADATVSYQKIDNRLIYVYTDADGNFAIPGPAEWNLKDLPMYKNPTAVIKSLRDNHIALSEIRLSSHGSVLELALSASHRVTIDLYTVNGRMERQVYNGELSQGRYSIDLSGAHRSAHQIYLARIRVGSETRCLRLVNLAARSTAGSSIAPSTTAALSRLVKTSAVVDTLRAGKSNFTAVTVALESYAQNAGAVTIKARDIEQEIATLMTGKNDDWKAGQCVMGQTGVVASNYGTWWFGIGGFTGNGETFAQRADEIDRLQKIALNDCGLPHLVACDAVHGLCIPPYGTVMPHNLGLGCSHNGPLIELAERINAIENRAGGVNWVFAPCFDVVRDERHGRTYEGWDEGPEQSAYYAYYAIRGLQTSDLSHPLAVVATMKHFAGAGGTMDGKHGTDATTGDNATLARIHLPPFRAAARAGAGSCMAAFNQWLGLEMHLHKALLTDTLKNAWQWDGFVCGDWNEAQNLGVKACFEAGVDNPMVTKPGDAFTAMKSATPARLTDGCKRMVRIKTRMNLVQSPYAKREYLGTLFSEAHKAVARECVRRSLVLLKNTGAALPISKTSRVHVVGAWADDMGRQSGGWTNGWQGGSNQNSPPGTSILEGIREVCPGATYAGDANTVSADADVIVVVVGEEPYAESPGDNMNPVLSAVHQALIAKCDASNKKVVAILITGRPLIITPDIEKCDAFVVAWLPGSQGGGIADVLFNVNGEDFTGTLSHTWPASVAQIPINYGNFGDRVGGGGTPLFPYGFGLKLSGEQIKTAAAQ